ncbi:hypothetical protein KUCAC02_012293 [Chaenocephalus aceratus]|uniref:Uncharacterized protein n=1 Tax=Chaenocephalus aceratus TaxID=36190 RepID=A0ACB9XB01_CHAAC|nr:hypothetical protein KUCAC02_012293 [Chaenocephalus aceratus]
MLSNKFRYPSFSPHNSQRQETGGRYDPAYGPFHTGPGLLSWAATNSYGLEGMQSLSEQAPKYGICIAYQGVTTTVVSSSKSKLKHFFPFVIERNVTGKVWIGTEDWSKLLLSYQGFVGSTLLGLCLACPSNMQPCLVLKSFEDKVVEAAMQQSDTHEVSNITNDCLQGTDLYSLAGISLFSRKNDITSSLNVYKAVYSVAHALHRALGCDSGECQMRDVYPWELLWLIKDVHFYLGNTSVYYDSNGDAPTGYDIVLWVWNGTEWSLRELGSFSPDPITLTIDADLIDWDGTGDSRLVPLSICSPPCPFGHKRLQTGQHICCFDCQACPSATFLNTSEPTTCQPCLPEEWAPPKSEQCLKRTVLLLPWDAPLSIALLFFLATCLLMTSSSAIILLLNLNTPVAKSAGGRTCLLMLAALTASAMSTLCHFGQPSPLACILKQPLFIFSFTVCLACITVRSIQPSKDLHFYEHSIVLECSNTLSPGALNELAYVSLLSALCFSFSYMGKDLPANYNEAKSVTFSLMVYMMSWMSFFTLYLISRGPFTTAAHVFAILFSVLAFLMGYFFPKIYIIALKPQMNTNAHFQNCIQMYTMNK